MTAPDPTADARQVAVELARMVGRVSARDDLPEPQAEWQNGLNLLSLAIEGSFEPSAALTIVSSWHYAEVAPQQYHFFNHLLYEGQLVAQVDGPGVPAWYWREDDVLETRFQLILPAELAPGDYRLRVGVYGWPDLQRVLLSDSSDGLDVAEWTLP